MSAYALPNLFTPPVPLTRTNNRNRVLSDETKECFDEPNPKPNPELNPEPNQVDVGQPILTSKMKNNRMKVTKSFDVDVQVQRVIFEPIFRRVEQTNIKQKETEDDAYKPFRFITLELEISSYGRKYIAKRPFRHLLKLRADLVRECEKMGHFHCNVPELPNSTTVAKDNEDSRRSVLSKFPVAHSGYCIVQNLIRDYRPAIQIWFRIICEKYPMSMKLASFLWEPLNITRQFGGRYLPSISECSEWDEEKKDDISDENVIHFPRFHKVQSFLTSRSMN